MVFFAWLTPLLLGLSTWAFRSLIFLIPFVVKYLLIALGVGYVTYVGLDYAIDEGVNFLFARYDALPPELIDIIEVMGVFDALQIITTAASSAITIKAIGGLTRFAASRPGTLSA